MSAARRGPWHYHWIVEKNLAGMIRALQETAPYVIFLDMATIQEATESAMTFARQSLGSARTQGLQLEEIESGTEGGTDVWRITLSMPDSNAPVALAPLLNPNRREFKTFTVVKSTGEVTSMKMREMSRT
jgi:hypothetical protein